MDLVLIPGFWLDAAPWDPIVPALQSVGHHVHGLTRPGKQGSRHKELVDLPTGPWSPMTRPDELVQPVILAVGPS